MSPRRSIKARILNPDESTVVTAFWECWLLFAATLTSYVIWTSTLRPAEQILWTGFVVVAWIIFSLCAWEA